MRLLDRAGRRPRAGQRRLVATAVVQLGDPDALEHFRPQRREPLADLAALDPHLFALALRRLVLDRELLDVRAAIGDFRDDRPIVVRQQLDRLEHLGRGVELHVVERQSRLPSPGILATRSASALSVSQSIRITAAVAVLQHRLRSVGTRATARDPAVDDGHELDPHRGLRRVLLAEQRLHPLGLDLRFEQDLVVERETRPALRSFGSG